MLFSRTVLVRNPIHMASFFPKIHSRIPGRDGTHCQELEEVRLYNQSGTGRRWTVYPVSNRKRLYYVTSQEPEEAGLCNRQDRKRLDYVTVRNRKRVDYVTSQEPEEAGLCNQLGTGSGWTL